MLYDFTRQDFTRETPPTRGDNRISIISTTHRPGDVGHVSIQSALQKCAIKLTRWNQRIKRKKRGKNGGKREKRKEEEKNRKGTRKKKKNEKEKVVQMNARLPPHALLNQLDVEGV